MPTDPHPTSDPSGMRTILFVCTGNTCRSPMAQAIAEGLLSASEEGAGYFVASAGVSAMSGSHATPEAEDAVRALGFALHDHRSNPLSAAMIEKAHAVYALTESHLRAIVAMAPEFADRVHILDPDGGDVPDPIGHPAPVYLETARRLRAMIEERLRGLGVTVNAGATS